jgi:hypothetical protein
MIAVSEKDFFVFLRSAPQAELEKAKKQLHMELKQYGNVRTAKKDLLNLRLTQVRRALSC